MRANDRPPKRQKDLNLLKPSLGIKKKGDKLTPRKYEENKEDSILQTKRKFQLSLN